MLGENILLALLSLRANKMRALLTLLGIIIGIGSVIAIMCVGDSLTLYMTTTMNDMGAGNIMVIVQEYSEDSQSGPQVSMSMGVPQTPTEEDLISDEHIETFLSRFEGTVKAVSASQSVGSGKAQDGRKYANVSISGVTPGYMDANDFDMLSGRFITDRDIKSVKNVAVVSDDLVDKMFLPSVDPMGKEIKIYVGSSFTTYTIVGVYHYVPSPFEAAMGGTANSKDKRTNMYIPISVAKKDDSVKGYQMITAVAVPGVDMGKLTSDIKAFWNKTYERNTRWKCEVINMESMIDQMSSILGTLSTAVAIIAAISLLVGGIGVMNIMLVSVTERTREIGTRKALGAKNQHIRTQFIMEALIICVIGGIIGIILGMLLGYIGSTILGFPATVSVGIIVLCVGFSMVIGIFFGAYPANKAAKLDPIEALRYE